MDGRGAPLTMTKTLGPAIAFVAETAGGLIRDREEQRRRMNEAKGDEDTSGNKKVEKETVVWVLAAPERLEKLLAEKKREEAEKDWMEIEKLLDAWGGVKGVAEVREACEKVMGKAGHDD